MVLQAHLRGVPSKGDVPAGPRHGAGTRVQEWAEALRELCEPRLGGERAGGQKALKMSKTKAAAGSALPQAERPGDGKSPLSEQPGAGSTQSVAFHLNPSGVSQREESL